MSPGSLLVKLLRSPLVIARLLGDRVIWPRWMSLAGVDSQAGLTLVGKPTIRMASRGAVRLGRNVKLFSRRSSNPLMLSSPCALIALTPEATIRIGDNSSLSGAVICAATRVELGDEVLVGANARIFDTDFHPLSAEERRHHPTRGAAASPITIGNRVFIGAQAIIMRGTRLADGCVVAAGAVVRGSFPESSVIVGNPGEVAMRLVGRS